MTAGWFVYNVNKVSHSSEPLPRPTGPGSIYLCLPFPVRKNKTSFFSNAPPSQGPHILQPLTLGSPPAGWACSHLRTFALAVPLLRMISPELCLGLALSPLWRGLLSLPPLGQMYVGILCAVFFFQIFCEVKNFKLKNKTGGKGHKSNPMVSKVINNSFSVERMIVRPSKLCSPGSVHRADTGGLGRWSHPILGNG